MQRLGAEIDRPISFGMIQVDAAPDLWREQLDISAAAHAAGSELYPRSLRARSGSPPIHSSVIEIAHAPRAAANSADDEIIRLVEADQAPQDLTVVTSDSALAERIRSAGASVYPAAGFRNRIDPPA